RIRARGVSPFPQGPCRKDARAGRTSNRESPPRPLPLATRARVPYIPHVLTIHTLTKTLGGRTLFRDAEMTINWGERIALVGPNGAGKSTLFRMILGQEEIDGGTIERDEYAITGHLAQEAGDPGDETVLEIAMGITPEMVGYLRT